MCLGWISSCDLTSISLSNGFTFYPIWTSARKTCRICRLVSMCIPFYLSLFPWMERGQMGSKWPKTHKLDCLESVGKILDNGMRSIFVTTWCVMYNVTRTHTQINTLTSGFISYFLGSGNLLMSRLLSQKFIM